MLLDMRADYEVAVKKSIVDYVCLSQREKERLWFTATGFTFYKFGPCAKVPGSARDQFSRSMFAENQIGRVRHVRGHKNRRQAIPGHHR
jgi:hypothetical protein